MCVGRFFAYEWYGSNFQPDYVMVGKGLGIAAFAFVDRPCKLTASDSNNDPIDVENEDEDEDNDVVINDDEEEREVTIETGKGEETGAASNTASLLSSSLSSSSSRPVSTFLSPFDIPSIKDSLDEFASHVTYECSAILFLQAATLLKRIREGDLMLNAYKTGKHIMKRLRLLEDTKQITTQSNLVTMHAYIHTYIHT
jgi:hypothetical protein